jgi:MFS family permease
LFANLSLGFCTSIYQVYICVVLIGAANGNIALLRTLVADIVSKDMQARAFSFLPTATALATILGKITFLENK